MLLKVDGAQFPFLFLSCQYSIIAYRSPVYCTYFYIGTVNVLVKTFLKNHAVTGPSTTSGQHRGSG
jgi:hypothetical protein